MRTLGILVLAACGSAWLAAGAVVAQGAKPVQATPAPATLPAIEPLPVPELGVWIDDTGTGAVEIAVCGDKLCGSIVWLDKPVDAKGRPVTDGNNPDRAKRSQAVCGLQVIGNLVRQRDGSWDKGWVYDPKTGDRFDLAMKLTAPDKLIITGYVGVKLLSEDFVWTRAPADRPLQRCSAQVPAPTPVRAR